MRYSINMRSECSTSIIITVLYCTVYTVLYVYFIKIIMDRKIWAFSQKMSWLFWLFWLFLYLSLGKMAFSSWLFWLFAQKARLFWLFAKLGYIVVAFVDVYKLIYHFFHYKVLFTSIFWLFPGFCKKTVCSARLLYLAVRK